MTAGHSTKTLKAGLILPLALISSCFSPAVEEGPPLTVMVSTGTVEFHRFVSVFSSICLANFPDTKATVQQFERLGYEALQRDLINDYGQPYFRQLYDKSKEVFVEVGDRVLVSTGGPLGGGRLFGAAPLQFVSKIERPRSCERNASSFVHSNWR